MTSTDVDRVAAIEMFSDLDRSSLEKLAEVCVPFDAPKGHNLIEPGLVAAGVFIFEEGTARVEIHDHRHEVGPGQIVGEIACLDSRALHTGRVHTTSEVSGVCIQRDDFMKLLETEPAITFCLLKVVASRFVDAAMS
jgi:CRP-like cAMP-binding protein